MEAEEEEEDVPLSRAEPSGSCLQVFSPTHFHHPGADSCGLPFLFAS